MLLPRIITAIILIPCVLWAVMGTHGATFALLAGAFFSLGAWEWAKLCRFNPIQASGYVVSFMAILLFSFYFANPMLLSLGALFGLMSLYWCYRYQGIAPLLLKNQISLALIGLFYLAMAWYGLCVIDGLSAGKQWIILLFLLVWSSDTFAYFAGRAWGKTPFSPLISPKKTMAGFWGGVMGALMLASVAFMVLRSSLFQPISFFSWLSIAWITILLAILGDLFESLIKRLSGVKDSGNILPGHGGILDRTDSLIAAIPFYALSLTWIQGG